MTSDDFEPGFEFFQGLAPAPGPKEERMLSIGPFAISLLDLPANVVPDLSEQYLGFIGPSPSAPALHLRFRPARVRRFLASAYDRHGFTAVRTRHLDGHIFLYGHDFAGFFTHSGTEAALAPCTGGWAGLELALENFLRLYCAWQAIHAQGFLIHAAAVVREGRAFIFFGHSGAGKTTVAELSRGLGFVLSDDITLVTLDGGEYRAHSVPFRGRFRERLVTERRTYPIAGLYHLVQAKQNRVQPLPRVRAVADVLSCLPFVTDRMLPNDPAETILVLQQGLQTLPVFQLEFRNSVDFWDAVLRSVG